MKLSSLDEATACRLPLLRNQFLIEVISILVSPVLLSNFFFFMKRLSAERTLVLFFVSGISVWPRICFQK